MHGLARVLGQIGQHPPVLGREAVVPRAQAEHELPELHTAVREGERHRVTRELPVGRDSLQSPALLDLDRGVGQAQRLRDRLDHARQDGVGRRARLQPRPDGPRPWRDRRARRRAAG